MRGEEPQKAGGGQPLTALDARERALECSRSSPTSHPPPRPHRVHSKGRWPWAGGQQRGWEGESPPTLHAPPEEPRVVASGAG